MIDFLNTDIQFFIAVAYVVTAFVFYYAVVGKLKQRSTAQGNNTVGVLTSRAFGVLLFGIVPLAYLYFSGKNIHNFGIHATNQRITLYAVLILLPIVTVVSGLNSGKEQNLKMYPEIREKSWKIKLLVISALSWLFYIFAYEFLFRGVLLFISLDEFDAWEAVIINSILYAAAHIPKGKKETLASIPFGLILCIITLRTGNIWACFTIHGLLALSNEWFSLKAHPEMTLQIKKPRFKK